MGKLLGYGEDALTSWALKNHLYDVLKTFKDQTNPIDCLVFYRPSFGRAGGKNSSEFGEFDAIVISRKRIYLIESKWDNLSETRKIENRVKNLVKPEQKLRHEVFSWYLTHWNKKYLGNWEAFQKEQEPDFQKSFRNLKEFPKMKEGSLLLNNLELVLNKSLEHCQSFQGKQSITNVLLFFYRGKKPKLPDRIEIFDLIEINYCENLEGNFIILD